MFKISKLLYFLITFFIYFYEFNLNVHLYLFTSYFTDCFRRHRLLPAQHRGAATGKPLLLPHQGNLPDGKPPQAAPSSPLHHLLLGAPDEVLPAARLPAFEGFSLQVRQGEFRGGGLPAPGSQPGSAAGRRQVDLQARCQATGDQEDVGRRAVVRVEDGASDEAGVRHRQVQEGFGRARSGDGDEGEQRHLAVRLGGGDAELDEEGPAADAVVPAEVPPRPVRVQGRRRRLPPHREPPQVPHDRSENLGGPDEPGRRLRDAQPAQGQVRPFSLPRPLQPLPAPHLPRLPVRHGPGVQRSRDQEAVPIVDGAEGPPDGRRVHWLADGEVGGGSPPRRQVPHVGAGEKGTGVDELQRGQAAAGDVPGCGRQPEEVVGLRRVHL